MKERKGPYFTIIVPSYNQAVFLRENLSSIEKQSFSDWEVIIMDGGSSDDSTSIIQSFEARNPGKVRWQSKKDGGQVKAINLAMKKAKGKVVSYLNSDDKYEKDALRIVYKKFESTDSDWIYGDCYVSKTSLKWTFFYKSLWPIDTFPQLLYLLNPINQPSVFLKNSFVKKVGSFDEKFKLAFDYEYWIRCAKYSKPGRIKKTLAFFRVHKQAKSSLGFANQFAEELKALNKHGAGHLWYIAHKLHNFCVVCIYTLLK